MVASSSPTFPAVAGDWIAAGYNFFAGVWTVASGPNQIELTVLDWFRSWLGMPAGTSGLLTSGGAGPSSAPLSRSPRLTRALSKRIAPSTPRSMRSSWSIGE